MASRMAEHEDDQMIPEPQDLSVSELAALPIRDYANELRVRLRREEAWAVLLDPTLIERTRHALTRIIASIDVQRLNAAQKGTTTPEWLRSINSLQQWSRERLEALPAPQSAPVSVSREARLWRALAAELAHALACGDLDAIDRVKTPFGNLTARQWISARADKEATPDARTR